MGYCDQALRWVWSALDGSLDADRGVHGGHDRGGHLDDGRVAAEQVRRQPANIQADAAANCYDRLLAPAMKLAGD